MKPVPTPSWEITLPVSASIHVSTFDERSMTTTLPDVGATNGTSTSPESAVAKPGAVAPLDTNEPETIVPSHFARATFVDTKSLQTISTAAPFAPPVVAGGAATLHEV